MTIVKHELRQGWKSFVVWTASILFFVLVCVFLFPEMKKEMEGITNIFASMGAFTAAFGMDRLNFGTLIGFYSIECGNILGIGGAFFASLIGISALAKEEKERTVEFLLTHPVSRIRVITEKLAAVLVQLIAMNGIVFAGAAVSVMAIGEEVPWKEICLLHLAYFLLQMELAGICFGISAFIRSSGLGIGMGIAAVMYFLNIIANISDSAEFMKYITPFGYADSADIITSGGLDIKMLLPGMGIMVLCVVLAYWKYYKKDIK